VSSTLRRLLAALLIAGSCVLVTALPAQACSCASATTQSHTKSAKAVFTGTVTSVTGAGKVDGQRGATYTQQVEVDRVYKGGISTATVEVVTDAGGSGTGQCGLGGLVPGRSYMFFVQSDGETWTAAGCGGTAPASEHLVTQVVRLLGDGRPPMPPEPQQAVFTNVSDGEPTTLTRAAAPGLALVLVGLLGLVVVRRMGRRTA
jgi:hypothetical protein